MKVSAYNLEAKYYVNEYLRKLDDSLIDSLWMLFEQICKYWQLTGNTENLRYGFLVFVSNRIDTDLRYLAEYVNYEQVIEELKTELGTEKAFVRLFTDALANVSPPVTRLARARQMVSNEFIALALSLGGFKTFGKPEVADGVPINYPGYIAGMNRDGSTPYRTYNDE